MVIAHFELVPYYYDLCLHHASSQPKNVGFLGGKVKIW